MAQSDHNPEQTNSDLDISIGRVFACREGGPSVSVDEMNNVPDDCWENLGLSTGTYVSPVVVLVDYDNDATPIYSVGFHGCDNQHRLALIDEAIAALEFAREALQQARHVERPDLSRHPNLRRGRTS